MKNINRYIIVALAFYSIACNTEQPIKEDKNTSPKTPVKVVTASSGSIANNLKLFGTTAYLKRNLVVAPIPSFIVKVKVSLGQQVSKGATLYILQSKESKALGNNLTQIDSSLSNFGIIEIKASASGIISTLDKQQAGDYILEGTQLCTIAESSDLVFQVNVPFEYHFLAKKGNGCTLVLPDKSEHKATFTTALTTMNKAAQTQTILAKCNKNLFLPENMIVEVMVNQTTAEKTQLLPKSAVLSDEMMSEFWVMKLINDSIAIKTPVTIGNKSTTQIEILTPVFTKKDNIISVGNYGLNDTALVVINK